MMAGPARRLPLLLLLSASALAQHTLKHAWDLAARGQQPDAIRVLNELIRGKPDDFDSRLLLGSLLMETGDRAGSLEQLTVAVRLRPKSAEAENALGEAREKFGDSAGARDAFEKAVALDPHSGAAQLNLGQMLLAAGEMKPAADCLDRAIALLGLNDDAATAHYLRAKAYTAAGDVKSAAAHLTQAVKIRPAFAQAWSDLGQVRRTLLDGDGALAAFQTAARLDPADAVAQYRLGAEYLRAGKTHLAVEYLENASRLAPADQSTLNALQMALRQDGRMADANSVKQRLVDQLREKDQISRNQLTAIQLNNEGAALEASKDLRGALEKYSAAAKLYPDMNGIRVNHAVALLRLGQWKEGLEELHQAALREPEDPRIKRALQEALSQAPMSLRPEWSREAR